MSFLSISAESTLLGQTYTELLADKRRFQPIEPAIDYTVTAFGNFTFFGSALTNVNATVNRILETWPVNNSTISAATTAVELAQKYYDCLYTPWERNILDGFSTSSCTGTTTAGKTVSYPNVRRDINDNLLLSEDTTYVEYLQDKADEFDSLNDNLIRRLVPEYFLDIDDADATFEKFLYLMGRFFDEIKGFINQLENMFTVSYSNYDRVPDGAIKLLLKNMGFNLVSSFMTKAVVWFLSTANELPPRVIETEMWKRLLNNIVYIYKTKGTRQSINALLNCFGLPDGFISVDEYMNYEQAESVTASVSSETYSLGFNDTERTIVEYIYAEENIHPTFEFAENEDFTFELQFQAPYVSATAFMFGIPNVYEVFLGDETLECAGFAYATISSDSDYLRLATASAHIFDGRLVHLFFRRNSTLSSYDLFLKTRSEDNVYTVSANVTGTPIALSADPDDNRFVVGGYGHPSATGAFDWGFTGQSINFRLYSSIAMTERDMDKHVLDPINSSIEQGRGYLTHQYPFNEPLDSVWRASPSGFKSFPASLTSSKRIENTIDNDHYLIADNFLDGNHHKKLENITYTIVDTKVGKEVDNFRVFDGVKSKFIKSLPSITVYFRPVDPIDTDIRGVFGPIDIANIIGDPQYLNYEYYPVLRNLSDIYFRRFDDPYTFATFLELIEEYGPHIIRQLKQLIPARTKITGKGMMIRSHVLERSRQKKESLSGEEISLDEHPQIGLDETIFSDYSPHKVSATAHVMNLSLPDQLKAGYDGDILDERFVRTRSTKDQQSITGHEVEDDVILKGTQFNTTIVNNQYVLPAQTNVDENQEKVNFFTRGEHSIHLTPRNLLSNPAELTVLIEDKDNCAILGNRIRIQQSPGDPTAFEISNSDLSLTSDNIITDWPIVDVDGLDLSLAYQKDSKIGEVIEELPRTLAIDVIIRAVDLDRSETYPVTIRFPVIGRKEGLVDPYSEIKTTFSPTLHISDVDRYIWLGLVDTTTATVSALWSFKNNSNKVDLDSKLQFESARPGGFAIKNEDQDETYLEGVIGSFERRTEIRTEEKFSILFDRNNTQDPIEDMLSVTGNLKIYTNDLLNKLQDIPIFTTSISSDPWLWAFWRDKHITYTTDHMNFGAVGEGSTAQKTFRLINAGGMSANLEGIQGESVTSVSGSYFWVFEVNANKNTEPLTFYSQEEWIACDTNYISLTGGSATAEMYPGNSQLLTVAGGTSGVGWSTSGSFTGNLTASVMARWVPPPYLRNCFPVAIYALSATVFVGSTGGTEAWTADISGFNITNPYSPSWISTFYRPRAVTALACEGNYLYASVGMTAEIIDISDYYNPSVEGSIDHLFWPDWGARYMVAGEIAGDTHCAYSVGDEVGLIDASDPANPTVTDTVSADATTYLTDVEGLDLSGDYIFATSPYDNALTIIWAGDPNNLTVSASISSIHLDEARGVVVDVERDIAYVAYKEGVSVWDCSTVELPTFVTTLTGAWGVDFADCYRVKYQNYIVYLTSKGSNMAITIDATSTGSLTAIDYVEITDAQETDLEISSSAFCVTNGNRDELHIIEAYDTSDITIAKTIVPPDNDGNGLWDLWEQKILIPWKISIYPVPGISWVRQNDGDEVLDIGASGRFDDERVGYCSILKENSTYYMWYSGYGGLYWMIGAASSTDGITWTRLNGGWPVVESTGGVDDWDVMAPSVVKISDNEYWMWYTNYITSAWSTQGYFTQHSKIQAASSTDKITWTKVTTYSIPALDVGSIGKFDWRGVGYPTVIKDGDTFKMWYSGYDGTHWLIGYATSVDGTTWTRQNNGNPVITGGSPDKFDTRWITHPSVLQDGSTYKMWYTGRGAGTVLYEHGIGYIISTDGINWNRQNNGNPVMILGDDGKFDDREIFEPMVIKDENIFRMWYTGSPSSGKNQIGYATS